MQSSEFAPAVAAGHPVTADVGVEILSAGGTAGDAAAAMVLGSCVAETIFTGLSGGGFAVYVDGESGTTSCLDFFVSIPGIDGRVASPAGHLVVDFGGQEVPYAIGPATVTVHGVPAGVAALHDRWGRLPWSEVVEPARRRAAQGTLFTEQHSIVLKTVASVMLLGGGAEVYAPDGEVLAPNATLHQPGLSDALGLLAAEGPAAFYVGDVAAATVAATADGGNLSLTDLAAYHVIETRPKEVALDHSRVCSRGNDLDNFLGTLQAITLSHNHAETLCSMLSAMCAPARRGDTTSLAVVDQWGNACAATTSLGLASGVWLEQYGLHLNSMLGEGELLRGDLVPGARMGSMMTPFAAFDEGGLCLLGGAAGGSRIRTALTQVVVNVLHRGLDVQSAITAPRFNPVPGRIHYESGFPSEVFASYDNELVAWPRLNSYFGGVAAIGRSGPGADPRRGGDVRVV